MRKTCFVFAPVIAVALALTGCTPADAPGGANAEKASAPAALVNADGDWAAIEEAYSFALPLVLLDATAANSTNTLIPTDTQAPVNQMIHASRLANAATRFVVTPNVDTIYTQVFFDLAADAMVFKKPAADRFYSVELLDAYTNSTAILGTGGDTQEEKTYLIAGPGFDGEAPAGMELVRMPTNNAWMLARVMVENTIDLENVYAIQRAMELTPLSSYGKAYTPPEGSYDAANEYVPIEHVLAMTPGEFFTRANALMAANPPAAADHEIVERMARINVGAGLTFDEGVLGADAAGKWAEMLAGLEVKLVERSSRFMEQMGIWRFFGEPIAEFGTEYDYRALVAIGGLGANPVSVAIYPQASHDGNAQILNGENAYTLHFNTPPPVEAYGFWSITAYGEDDFLIDNELNRYTVNDRSELRYGEDGSLDILVQANPPEDAAMLGNWLPVHAEQFHLVLRVYLPHADILNGAWTAPDIAANG